MKVFTVFRVGQGPFGGIAVPMVTCDNEQVAKTKAMDIHKFYADLMHAKLVMPDGADTGLVLGNVLQGFGLHQINHPVMATEIEGLLSKPPERRIILDA